MILPAQTIKELNILDPCHSSYDVGGMSAGLGPCSYDMTLNENLSLRPGEFKLASCVEKFNMPHDVAGEVKDKSTLARLGVAVQNTFVDPGFRGFLTVEVTNHGPLDINLEASQPICQVVFYRLETETEIPYMGKYQDQSPGPQVAR